MSESFNKKYIFLLLISAQLSLHGMEKPGALAQKLGTLKTSLTILKHKLSTLQEKLGTLKDSIEKSASIDSDIPMPPPLPSSLVPRQPAQTVSKPKENVHVQNLFDQIRLGKTLRYVEPKATDKPEFVEKAEETRAGIGGAADQLKVFTEALKKFKGFELERAITELVKIIEKISNSDIKVNSDFIKAWSDAVIEVVNRPNKNPKDKAELGLWGPSFDDWINYDDEVDPFCDDDSSSNKVNIEIYQKNEKFNKIMKFAQDHYDCVEKSKLNALKTCIKKLTEYGIKYESRIGEGKTSFEKQPKKEQ
jgi:hypothetical protein